LGDDSGYRTQAAFAEEEDSKRRKKKGQGHMKKNLAASRREGGANNLYFKTETTWPHSTVYALKEGTPQKKGRKEKFAQLLHGGGRL